MIIFGFLPSRSQVIFVCVIRQHTRTKRKHPEQNPSGIAHGFAQVSKTRSAIWMDLRVSSLYTAKVLCSRAKHQVLPATFYKLRREKKENSRRSLNFGIIKFAKRLFIVKLDITFFLQPPFPSNKHEKILLGAKDIFYKISQKTFVFFKLKTQDL